MNINRTFLLLLFFLIISCIRDNEISIKNESIKKYYEINFTDTQMGKIKLSFDMSVEEIETYYQMIDNLIDKESNVIDIGVVDAETKEQITSERSDKSKFFEEDVEFVYNNMRYIFPRSPIRPDGYVNFNNYYYRITNSGNQPEIIRYAEESINPLRCNTGFVIIENDVPVYEGYYLGEIPNRQFAGWKEVGLLKSGTVIMMNGIPINNYIYVVRSFYLKGDIKATDIGLLEYLQSIVSYRIEDDKLYRYIDGQRIEIHFNQWGSASGYYENGYRYIRNEFNNKDQFYFWEVLGDYLFDENGNFIEVVEYGPGWTGK